jgi:hypothetical protein
MTRIRVRCAAEGRGAGGGKTVTAAVTRRATIDAGPGTSSCRPGGQRRALWSSDIMMGGVPSGSAWLTIMPVIP